MQIPFDSRVKEIKNLPYTISFVIRKRQQVDNLNELPKEKRVPEEIIWDGNSDDIENWLDRVFKKGESNTTDIVISNVEGS